MAWGIQVATSAGTSPKCSGLEVLATPRGSIKHTRVSHYAANWHGRYEAGFVLITVCHATRVTFTATGQHLCQGDTEHHLSEPVNPPQQARDTANSQVTEADPGSSHAAGPRAQAVPSPAGGPCSATVKTLTASPPNAFKKRHSSHLFLLPRLPGRRGCGCWRFGPAALD